MDTVETINIKGLTIRFLLSYEKTLTLKETLIKSTKSWNYNHISEQKKYHTALSNINLIVNQGDIIGIVGPNGCGKSTLLRAISGIYSPDDGSIECYGKISTLLSLGSGFNNKLNAIDNIRLNGLTIGMSLDEIERKIPSIIEFAEIGDYVHVPMKYYSSGMISRLSFSIVLAMQPDILLIDEIFSVGDLAFQKKSEKAMHQLLSSASCQLIVTHSLSLVKDHCNRAIFMEKGKIILDGEPNDVVNYYEKRYG